MLNREVRLAAVKSEQAAENPCGCQIWIEQERAISEDDRAIEVADEKAKRMRRLSRARRHHPCPALLLA